MDGFVDLPPGAQMEPIPDGFELLPDDAQIEPAAPAAPAPLSDADYQKRLHDMVVAGAPRAQIDALIKGQGIDPSQVTGIDEALAAVKQGRGVVVQGTGLAAAPESVGQALYRGVGDVVGGLADLPGLLANPLNAGVNYVSEKLGFGRPLSEDLGQTFRDMTGAPEPVTSTERYLSAGARGGSAALTGAGVGGLLSEAPAMLGYVARNVASAPGIDLASGVASGLGAEGGGDVGQSIGGVPGRIAGSLLGGLAGGLAGGSGGKAGRALAERFAHKVPEAIALNPNGTLTAEGHELALRSGVNEDEAIDAFARIRRSKLDRAPPGAQQRREANRGRVELPAEFEPSRVPEPAPTESVPIVARTQALIDGIAERLPTQEGGRGRVPPPPAETAAPDDAAGRFAEAQSEGVRLTRGQAEQNFDVQNDENSLRVSATREGEDARQFFRQQQQDMQAAVERLRANFGPDAGNAADRGEQVKDAVRQLRDSGKAGVQALYQQAEELGGEALKLDTKGIHDAATDVLIDEAVPEGVKKAVAQELARYGIIGEAALTNEAGITRVTLDDGSTVAFRGPVQELTASNAEGMRKAINRLYLSDPTRASQGIKPAIDQALEDAISGAANREGGIGQAYSAARDAHKAQRQTFHAKDIIENLIAVKKGTQTDVLLPERAIAQVIGAGKEGISNLRKVKALLLSGGHPSAQQAWRAIQHQALADIFGGAMVKNINHGGGEISDTISGAKLSTLIDKTYGVVKLRELLSPEDFNGLMKLRRVISNATIPISGTTNPSGTATKIINYMRQGTLRLAGPIPGLGTAVNAVAGLVAKGKEIAATQKTLAGIRDYDGRAATAKKLDQQAAEFVREFIAAGQEGRFMPTSINVATATSQGQRR